MGETSVASSGVTAATLFETVGETGLRSTALAELALNLARLGHDDEAKAALVNS